MLKEKIVFLVRSKTVQQTMMLSGAHFFAMGLGFLLSLVLPKLLGAYDYGLLSLCTAVVSFCATFFEFGIFASAARVLVDIDDCNIGAAVLSVAMRFLSLIALAFALFMWLVGSWIDDFQTVPVGHYLVVGSWLSVATVLPFAMTILLKATNEIKRLACFNILSKVLYFVAIVLAIWQGSLSVMYCYLAVLAAPILSFVCTMWRFIIMPVGIRKDILHEILRVNREFGIRNYMSRVIGAIGSQTNRIIIGFFCGAVDVGFFSLCNAFLMPAGIFIEASVASKFKSFGSFARISKRFFLFESGLVGSAVLLCGGIGYALFLTYYHAVYGACDLTILWLMGGALFLQGIAAPYNEWLAANGRGREMLAIGTTDGVIGFLANLAFISWVGIVGAGVASVVINLCFLLQAAYYYQKCRS